MKTITTWSGTKVKAERWPEVLKGWQRFAKKLLRHQAERDLMPAPKPDSLEYQLCEILQRHLGEIGCPPCGEGAVDVLLRIIRERNTALSILAHDRLRNPWGRESTTMSFNFETPLPPLNTRRRRESKTL